MTTRRNNAYRPPLPLTTEDKARVAAEVEAAAKRKRYKILLDKYDSDRSGKLSKDQMMKLLTELDTSTPTGTPPSDEELEFIMKFADKEVSFLGFTDGEIDASELELAVVAWETYLAQQTLIDETFQRFDRSGSGHLDKAELNDYLQSLNGGQDVTEEEVAWVLSMADVNGTGDLNRPEALIATLEWYTYVKTGEKKKKKRGARRACCIVL